MQKIYGNIVNISAKTIGYGYVGLQNGVIEEISVQDQERSGEPYILPGFVDSHVHIESSMLVPSEFAKMAVVHGTVATISDPHEIANVCGMEGVQYMIDNGKTVPFKFHFGAPSCVPATSFESAGAELDVEDVKELLASSDIFYLSEMMNFPGVLNGDADVHAKIRAAHDIGKPVDGHAPGLTGEAAISYINAGITTDHECFTEEEALHKLKNGMKILIREGSAAKNFEALIPLLNHFEDYIMFCSDDKHPDSLEEGHINLLCKRAVAKGIDVMKVLKAACVNPVLHYKMRNGLLQNGHPADFVVVKDLINFHVIQTYINGELVAENGKSRIVTSEAPIINNFFSEKKAVTDFAKRPLGGSAKVQVIEALDGQLITNKSTGFALIQDNNLVSNVDNDVLKLVVVNRYHSAYTAIAFVKNFGLKKGAIASTVAHDSHNILAIGVDDKSICDAVNLLMESNGGICAMHNSETHLLPLPVAGLMSNDDGYKVSKDYTTIDNFVKAQLGSTLAAPFMTLSFMALLVIPHLKLSDKGLFDGDNFAFTQLQPFDVAPN